MAGSAPETGQRQLVSLIQTDPQTEREGGFALSPKVAKDLCKLLRIPL